MKFRKEQGQKIDDNPERLSLKIRKHLVDDVEERVHNNLKTRNLKI